jgi:hypothetical protein
MSPVRYELGFYMPEDDILHSHRRENLKPYTFWDEYTTSTFRSKWEYEALKLRNFIIHPVG